MNELNPSQRLLMGPGPSNVDPRVLRAMSAPILGHLDPEFLAIMNETMALLRQVFRTENMLTLPMSGTGSSGMETVMVNLLEPGDRAIIGVNGLFGQRLADIAGRCGAEVTVVEAPWGNIIDPEQIESALKQGPAKLVAIVHAETSTGAHQPLEEITALAHQYGALMVVDTVTSLGGVPVEIDRWDIDAAYSGTQKCLSCPPGLAPVTMGPRALESLARRKTKVQSWYLDLSMIQKYWGQERFYHHTAPISMIYALREALRLIIEEGLEARFARHLRNSQALVAGLEAMGLRMFAQEGHRLPVLNAVAVPDGVDELALRRYLLSLDIEIGGGLGSLKGKIWRIGLMGYTSQPKNVMALLGAMETGLAVQGFSLRRGAALEAASAVYSQGS